MSESDRDARAVAWFSAMLLAARRGNFEAAGNASRELRTLGWCVERIDPLKDRHTPRQAADGREGGR